MLPAIHWLPLVDASDNTTQSFSTIISYFGPIRYQRISPMIGRSNIITTQSTFDPVDALLWKILIIAQTSAIRIRSPKIPPISKPNIIWSLLYSIVKSFVTSWIKDTRSWWSCVLVWLRIVLMSYREICNCSLQDFSFRGPIKYQKVKPKRGIKATVIIHKILTAIFSLLWKILAIAHRFMIIRVMPIMLPVSRLNIVVFPSLS